MICQWREIIDLQDSDKSRYFVITEVNNCFIIRSPSLFFNEYLLFSRKSDRKKEKSVLSFTHEQNIICSQTQMDYSRPLFVGNYLQATFWALDQ